MDWLNRAKGKGFESSSLRYWGSGDHLPELVCQFWTAARAEMGTGDGLGT